MALVPTALCSKASESLVCPESDLVHLFTMLAQNTVIKTSIFNILCLHSKMAVEVKSEGLLGSNSLLLEVEPGTLVFENCGTNAEHS